MNPLTLAEMFSLDHSSPAHVLLLCLPPLGYGLPREGTCSVLSLFCSALCSLLCSALSACPVRPNMADQLQSEHLSSGKATKVPMQ